MSYPFPKWLHLLQLHGGQKHHGQGYRIHWEQNEYDSCIALSLSPSLVGITHVQKDKGEAPSSVKTPEPS